MQKPQLLIFLRGINQFPPDFSHEEVVIQLLGD